MESVLIERLIGAEFIRFISKERTGLLTWYKICLINDEALFVKL